MLEHGEFVNLMCFCLSFASRIECSRALRWKALIALILSNKKQDFQSSSLANHRIICIIYDGARNLLHKSATAPVSSYSLRAILLAYSHSMRWMSFSSSLHPERGWWKIPLINYSIQLNPLFHACIAIYKAIDLTSELKKLYRIRALLVFLSQFIEKIFLSKARE